MQALLGVAEEALPRHGRCRAGRDCLARQCVYSTYRLRNAPVGRAMGANHYAVFGNVGPVLQLSIHGRAGSMPLCIWL